jgi:hypothetical protein
VKHSDCCGLLRLSLESSKWRRRAGKVDWEGDGMGLGVARVVIRGH